MERARKSALTLSTDYGTPAMQSFRKSRLRGFAVDCLQGIHRAAVHVEPLARARLRCFCRGNPVQYGRTGVCPHELYLVDIRGTVNV